MIVPTAQGLSSVWLVGSCNSRKIFAPAPADAPASDGSSRALRLGDWHGMAGRSTLPVFSAGRQKPRASSSPHVQ